MKKFLKLISIKDYLSLKNYFYNNYKNSINFVIIRGEYFKIKY